jgi:hypothetical protein
MMTTGKRIANTLPPRFKMMSTLLSFGFSFSR